MQRAGNPYYGGSPYPTDPAFGQIGSALATALFGNPEMAAQMGQIKAKTAYDQANTGKVTAETAAIEAKNAALGNLAQTFADPRYAPFVAAAQANPDRIDPMNMGSALAQLVAASVAAGGAPMTEDQARAALVAQGRTIDAADGLTAGYADKVRKEADDTKRFDITTRSADSRYGDQLDYGASIYGTNVSAATSRANNAEDNATARRGQDLDFRKGSGGRGGSGARGGGADGNDPVKIRDMPILGGELDRQLGGDGTGAFISGDAERGIQPKISPATRNYILSRAAQYIQRDGINAAQAVARARQDHYRVYQQATGGRSAPAPARAPGGAAPQSGAKRIRFDAHGNPIP